MLPILKLLRGNAIRRLGSWYIHRISEDAVFINVLSSNTTVNMVPSKKKTDLAEKEPSGPLEVLVADEDTLSKEDSRRFHETWSSIQRSIDQEGADKEVEERKQAHRSRPTLAPTEVNNAKVAHPRCGKIAGLIGVDDCLELWEGHCVPVGKIGYSKQTRAERPDPESSVPYIQILPAKMVLTSTPEDYKQATEAFACEIMSQHDRREVPGGNAGYLVWKVAGKTNDLTRRETREEPTAMMLIAGQDEPIEETAIYSFQFVEVHEWNPQRPLIATHIRCIPVNLPEEDRDSVTAPAESCDLYPAQHENRAALVKSVVLFCLAFERGRLVRSRTAIPLRSKL